MPTPRRQRRSRPLRRPAWRGCWSTRCAARSTRADCVCADCRAMDATPERTAPTPAGLVLHLRGTRPCAFQRSWPRPQSLRRSRSALETKAIGSSSRVRRCGCPSSSYRPPQQWPNCPRSVPSSAPESPSSPWTRPTSVAVCGGETAGTGGTRTAPRCWALSRIAPWCGWRFGLCLGVACRCLRVESA